MANTTDHTKQLLCHNAELKVELRLVKEQLDQARRSTTYLLERMSIAETPRTINHDLQRLEKEHGHILRENAQLKEMLRLTREGSLPTSRRIGSRTSYGVRGTLGPGRDHSPTFSYHRATESVASEQGNLLDLEDDASPTANAEPAYTTTRDPTPPLDSSENEVEHFSDIPEAVGLPIRRKKAANTSFGLGITGTDSYKALESGAAEASANASTGPSATTRKSGFFVYDSNGNRTWFKTPSPIFDNPAQEPHNKRYQPSGPAPFADFEHKRLMGAATFIEDMDEDEREEVWRLQAKNFPRHSAHEYKKYYCDTVRPAYLAKQSPKPGEEEAEQEASEQEATQNVEIELEPLPETSLTSATTNNNEILLEDEEEAQVSSSFNSTSAASGGVAVVQFEDAATNELGAAAEAQHDSMSAASTQDSESTVRPTPTAAPAFNQLSLSIHADPVAMLPEREPLASTERGNAAIALEGPPESIARLVNPWSFGPAYKDSMEESKAFAATATPGGQKARPRVPRPEEENVVAPPTPAFDGIANSTETVSRPLRRESPSTRCGFSRGYYPMNLNDIFYKPRPDDLNAFRTVVISNIPATVTLAQVLDTVRGGRIISSIYHETANFRTAPPVATNTVTVIFLKNLEASRFVSYTHIHPITFATSLLDPPTVAEVTLLQTPTRPIPDRLLFQAIPHGLTRTLYLHNLPPKLKEANDIVNKIQGIYPDVRRPLTAGYDRDGVMVFEYASMMEAEMAWVIIDKHPREFLGVEKGFLPDPCDRPVPKIREGGKDVEGLKEGVKTEGGREDKNEGGGEGELSEGGGEEAYEVRKDSVIVGGGGDGRLGETIYVELEEDLKMVEVSVESTTA